MRAFVQRHGDLLRALPEWTVRLLFFSASGRSAGRFARGSWRSSRAAFTHHARRALAVFDQIRMAAENRARWPSDTQFRCIQKVFDAPRYRVAHRRWLEDGDTALNVVVSGAIMENPERGAGRLECVVLSPIRIAISPPW